MTTHGSIVADHYARSGLLETIEAGVEALGKTLQTVTVADLAPIDEFHVGGRPATTNLLNQLTINKSDHVLDLGSGLGGLARVIASDFHASVVGVDLTPDYVEAASELTRWVGLGDRARFQVGSATELPFDPDSFDVATLLHVGMNIEDKDALFAGVFRVLRSGGRFGIYDNMWTGAEHTLEFPVPWAPSQASSFVETAATYQAGAEAAGFEVVSVRDRSEAALDFFAGLRKRSGDHDGPPPLGLHQLMGADAGVKTRNLYGAIDAGYIAPTELICIKP